MNFDKIFIYILFFSGFFITELDAKAPLSNDKVKAQNADVTGWRAACVRPTTQITMEVNNVRARLLTGGDIWNISRDLGGYIVPKPAPGQLPVSAIYAGGVWIGGRDRAGNTKLSGVTYRSDGTDFFAGPLDINGTTDKEVCDNWDRFFTVAGINVRNHYNKVIKFKEDIGPVRGIHSGEKNLLSIYRISHWVHFGMTIRITFMTHQMEIFL